ncbi:MAG: SiaB family protein kinase [Bacteroidota bacterium]
MDKPSLTYTTFNTFRDDKFSFIYQGYFTNNIVITAIELIEKNLAKHRGFKKLRHRLSYLMVESFQNITRYGDEPKNKEDKYRKELFLVRNIKEHFYIVSANIIENTKIDYVNLKIKEVNNLERDELNKLYRQVLTNNSFTDAGGAGLGFIEMVRKTKQKLEFDFVKINDKYSYFYLLIKIKGEKTAEDKGNYVTINWVKNFHIQACDRNLIAIHKGNFSPIVIDPVLSVVEKNITNKTINIQKLAYHLILEALQNVSLHSLELNHEKEAIFMISKRNGNFYISTGNFLKARKVELLKSQLTTLKKMDKTQIKNLYDEIIHKKSASHTKNKIGLGLIDIALESNNQFDYSFIDVTDNVSFYTFKVKV